MQKASGHKANIACVRKLMYIPGSFLSVLGLILNGFFCEEVANLGQELFLVGRLRSGRSGSFFFLVLAFLLFTDRTKLVHGLYDKVDYERHDKEVDDGRDEIAVIEGESLYLFRFKSGIVHPRELYHTGDIRAADGGDKRIDEVIRERGHDLLESAAYENADRKIYDIAFKREFLEFL